MCFISSRNGFKVLGGRNQSPHFLWFFYGKRNNVQNHLYLWVFCTRRTLVHQVHGLRCRGKWANLFPLTWWTVWSGIQHFIYGVLVGSSLSSLEQGCRTLLNTLFSTTHVPVVVRLEGLDEQLARTAERGENIMSLNLIPICYKKFKKI